MVINSYCSILVRNRQTNVRILFKAIVKQKSPFVALHYLEPEVLIPYSISWRAERKKEYVFFLAEVPQAKMRIGDERSWSEFEG